MDFDIFCIPYVFEVKESIFNSFTQLQCSGDFENQGQLPVSEVRTLGYCRLDLMEFSTILTFWMSMNLFLVVLHNHIRVTSKI